MKGQKIVAARGHENPDKDAPKEKFIQASGPIPVLPGVLHGPRPITAPN